MGKFNGILLCTDLDGTLYRKDKTVSQENRDAIEYFKQEGGLFTFITGRLPYYAQDAYRAAQPSVPFGCVNGGGVYDGVAGEYVWTCELPKRAMEFAVCVDEQFSNVGIQIVGFEKTCFLKENKATVIFRQLTGVPYESCAYDNPPSPIAKIMFCSEREEEILAIERMLKSHPFAGQFDFIRSERTLFEILPKGIHKGVALAKLIERFGIDPAKTIAVGDYDNDVGMLRGAGLGVAVANASAAAIEAADVVTVSNEEHAIAQVICDLESGKYAL